MPSEIVPITPPMPPLPPHILHLLKCLETCATFYHLSCKDGCGLLSPWLNHCLQPIPSWPVKHIVPAFSPLSASLIFSFYALFPLACKYWIFSPTFKNLILIYFFSSEGSLFLSFPLAWSSLKELTRHTIHLQILFSSFPLSPFCSSVASATPL